MNRELYQPYGKQQTSVQYLRKYQLQTNLAHMYFMQTDRTHHYQPYNETR
jgi:hypothetical protein